jgi:Ca2+-binding RTX toxin-like protein
MAAIMIRGSRGSSKWRIGQMALTRIDGTGLGDNLSGTFLDELINGFGGNDSLSGGDGNDQILGGNGNDTLNGGTGNDYIVGGAGGDTMDGGTGFDTLDTSFYHGGYTLDMVTGVTNFFDEFAYNFEKVKTGDGNDAIGGNAANNVIILGAGADFAFGGPGADTLRGNAGADRLNGGFGIDRLEGGAGQDTFVFNSQLNGSQNSDFLPDFDAAADTIRLSSAIFTSLAAGALGGGAFQAGTGATTAQHRIIYDNETGDIYYDADGTGATQKVLFARLAAQTALTAADFEVV